jgi:putative PIN family toxin of toxin-antitoxin system
MKVVLDTNVLISGMINLEGTPGHIVNLLINGRITLLYDRRILKEYVEVLNRRKFGFKKSMVAPFLDYIKNEGEYTTAEPINKVFADKDDKMFYEVAKTGKGKCIVTGNKNHYPDEEIIKSPKEFIELYLSENEEQRREST